MQRKKFTLLILFLLSLFVCSRAAYQPVTLTSSSYNQDIIANNTALPSASTTTGVTGSGTSDFVFSAQDYKRTAACAPVPVGEGLPNNGILNGLGLYQMASYTGNNALQLTSTSSTGTMTFVTPVATTDFYLLATSANAPGTVDVTVTFSDATTEVFTGINIDDWYGGTSAIVFNGIRVRRNASGCSLNTTARGNLYEFNFALSPGNYSKSITSISFSHANVQGEIIYIMGVSVNGPCTSPTAGTISSVSMVCPGVPFVLSSAVYSGDAISWEETIQGTANWGAIPGATAANYAVTAGQTIPMDYRAVVTCNANTVSSNVITIGINPFYDCYCSPLTGVPLHPNGTDVITNVTIQGTTLNSSNGTGANGVGYTKTNPALSGNTASLMQGTQYSIDVTQNGATAPVSGWIDYDQNGTFDAGEYISFSSVSPTHGTTIVPAASLTGLTGMRIRYSGFGAADACLTGGSETEDYTIDIVSAVNCTGTPDTGTATTTASPICFGRPFTLNATGVTVGASISYEWQESPQGIGSWTPVAGATNTSHVVTGGINSATDYRLVTTCGFGSSNNSNVVSVTMVPPAQCVCAPQYSLGCSYIIYDARIDSVRINGANNTAINNNASGCSSGGYGTYLGMSADVEVGATYQVPLTFTNTYPGATAPVAIWIDLDDDGIFNAAEMLDSDTLAASAISATLNLPIPAAAAVGPHRLRIRYVVDESFGALDPCADLGLGEAEDYMVNVVPATSCAGNPAAGTISSTNILLCPSNPNFTLNATGAASGGGISYQWEEMPQGAGMWYSISGATSISYTVTGGLTTPTDYRLIVICSGGGSSNSDTVTVSPAAPAQCVCTPQYSSGCSLFGIYNTRIDAVNIAGANNTSINNSSSGCSPGGYGVYLGQSADMEDGASYTANLSMFNNYPGSSGNPEAALWIDLDDDGLFASTERLGYAVLAPNAATANLSITIPIGTIIGPHRMRIRIMASNTLIMDPCADLSLGEAEDYMVNVVPVAVCSGTPAGGTASASLAYLCSATSFTLNATGAASGGSITYQWEELQQGTTIWNPISGATTINYTVTGGLTVATDYRLAVTCLTGGTGYSDTVTVELGTQAQCVCTPVYSYGCSYSGYNVNIENVNIQGANNTTINNAATGCSTAGYGTYLGMSVDMQAGASYSVPLGLTNTFPGTIPIVAVWIDLDDDGVFSTTEKLDHDTLTLNATAANLNIAIQAAAPVGPHRMRIRLVYDINVGAMDPCTDLDLGETEDYMINVVPLVNCIGSPAPGTAAATPSPVCSGASFTLSASGASSGAGISYQWEQMPQGATAWTPVIGATNISHVVAAGITVSTDYRLVTTCSFGTSGNSNTVTVTLTTPAQCVCTPTYSLGCSYIIYNFRIDGVTVNGANNTAVNNTSSGCSPGGYGTYLGQSVDLEAGIINYTVGLTIVNNYPGTPEAAVWIDLDDDGVFSTAEMLGTMTTPSSTPSINIPIPLTANLGSHRMRIRFMADNSAGAMDPCANLAFGEAEDYMVNIVAPLTIRLTDIKAENRGAKNIISWNTQSEDKGDYFVLERSFDGKQFDALATMDTRGHAASYHYEDISGQNGIHYYRLKMMDLAGKYSYSKIVSAYMNNTGFAVTIHPNPADKIITATIYSDKEETIQCEVIDLLGKTVIRSTTHHLIKGANAVELNVSGLSTGSYFIRLTGSRDNEVVRFIKK